MRTVFLQKLNKSAWLGACMLAVSAPLASAQFVPIVTNLFKVQAGSLYDLSTTNNFNRGIAISPVTGNVLYTSTLGGSNHVSVLDGQTGALLHTLDATGVSGGTLPLIGVRVAEDGAVYAMNLAGAGSTLKVYRWESETDTNPPLNVLSWSTATRIGDAIDLRGTGTNTQIIAAGSATSNPGDQWAFITPDPADPFLTNNMWIATFYQYPEGVPGGDLANGIAFEGTNNVILGKKNGNTYVRRVGFIPDLVSPTNWLMSTIEVGEVRFVGTDFVETNGVRLLSGVTFGSGTGTTPPEHRARVYDITATNAVSVVVDELMPGPYEANGNGIGASDIVGNKIAVLEPNNGLAVYRLALATAAPPSITSQPTGATNLLWGGYYTLAVSAGGSTPLRYAWLRDDTFIAGETNRTLSLTNVDFAQSAEYRAVITNVVGAITSNPARITVIPSAASGAVQPLWAKAPGQLFFLTTDNTQRGLAYNPATSNVLVVSRAPSNGVHVVNAATGAYLRSLDMTGVSDVSGATFQINMIAVSDDGAVYAATLTTGGASGYAIYRWENDSATAIPARVYEGNPVGERVGDTFSAFGGGMDTVLVAASRSGTNVAVFTTFDGVNFNPTTFAVEGVRPGFAGLGLFATATNEFYGKSTAHVLTRVRFDVNAQTHSVTQINAGTATVGPIAVDPANQILAGVVISQNPQNLAVYDLAGATDTNAPTRLIDQDWFATSTANGNGTGQIDIDFANSRIFALNSNNGLLALRYGPVLRLERHGNTWVMTWSGNATLTRSASPAGPFTDVAGATSPYTNTVPDTIFYRLRR